MSFKDKLFFGNGEGGDVLMGDSDDESDVGSDSEGLIRKLVRIDYNTKENFRGKFAHVAIVVDLIKPLLSKFRVDDNFQ
ncbi:hypothetical protein GH714_010941 [Hevea brasiliensis]|uniref:Uncharacterized protein n=1 Tax=Hevea brasiliensis TaxID=3981 RepID=A0A6A6KMY7_HEVBR|nr:hypothetical protein GH714_010941 [Hevea brasiliensis]